MQLRILHEVQDRLARRDRAYWYYPDAYAMGLLALAAGDGRPVAELRRGPFARLLDKPTVKAALAEAGGGRVDAGTFSPHRPDALAFHVTHGAWGADLPTWKASHHQTSRPGWNLVVQLNFGPAHERHYRALLRPVGEQHPFNYAGHPVARGDGVTLAWARLDVDLETGEALVEEVQSDWIRCSEQARAHRRLRSVTFAERHLMFGRVAGSVDGARIERYVERHLWPYRRVWAEATLWAAVEAARSLGLGRVFTHTFEGGCLLKDLRGRRRPPREIYTSLPRSFCFRRTREAPRYLAESRDRVVRHRLSQHEVEWQVLDLPSGAGSVPSWHGHS